MIHRQIGMQLVSSVCSILQNPKNDKITKMPPELFIVLCPDLNAKCFLLKRYQELEDDNFHF